MARFPIEGKQTIFILFSLEKGAKRGKHRRLSQQKSLDVRIGSQYEKMFVLIITPQQAIGSSLPSIGSQNAFANPVSRLGFVGFGAWDRQKVKHQDPVDYGVVPEGLGKIAPGSCGLAGEPTNVFPKGLTITAGITNFEGQGRDGGPLWVSLTEGATHLDKQRIHWIVRLRENK